MKTKARSIITLVICLTILAITLNSCTNQRIVQNTNHDGLNCYKF